MKTSHKSDELMLFVSILPFYSIFFIGIWNCPDSGIFLFSFISMRYHYIDIAKIRNKKNISTVTNNPLNNHLNFSNTKYSLSMFLIM